ncbi:MAG: AMP-binding protein [Arenicellales bacterium]|nr:AMP-binding protein [Arenicellales bacterium]
MIDIGTLLSRHARYRPDHLALVVGENRLSFAQFNSRVNRLANALIAAGLSKGDKVATVLPNCVELMTVYWAGAKTGIVVVPASTLLKDSGLATLLQDSDTNLVIADQSFSGVLDSIRGDLPSILSDRYVLTGPTGTKDSGFRSYDEFTGKATEEEPPDAGIVASDVYNIMYSSGTTGAPKGIVHTHFVRAMYCALFASAWRMTPESVVLHAGAIVFNGAMLDLMPWMFVGGTYILHREFDAGAVIRDIKKEKVTHIVMVPSQIVAVLNHTDFNPAAMESLEMIQNVGAPLHIEHKRRLNELLPGRFYELYGLTEGFVTVLDKHDAIRKVGSVGVPPPFFEMRILDEDGRECLPGQVGEICGRGPILSPGYYKRPDLTAKTVVDGWLHTGDVGYVDEDGYLFLVDRMKDMIISGGVNVYPKDIEEIVIQHPAVREVAVFGAQSDKWGETPVAAVILTEGASISERDLVQWANDRVDAKFQRISGVVILDAFPCNVAGKILKRELREKYRQRQTAGDAMTE